MEEEEENLFELLHLVETFNKMLSDKTVRYFDVDQFEAISDYFFDMGKLSKALKTVQLANEQHPNVINFLYRKVQFLTAANKTNAAKKALEQLEQRAPTGFELFMSKAALQSKLHNHQKAILHFKQALKHTNYPEDVWPLIAAEHQMLGQPSKAISYLHMALDNNPDDEVCLYHLATCYELLEHYEAGLNYFEEFVNANPYNEIGWFQLGVMCEKIDEHEKALEAFEYAYLIDDWFMAPYFEKAKILEFHFRYSEALEVYELALEVDEESSYIYYCMGVCHQKLHQRLKAESCFIKAIKYDEDFEEAFVEMALLKDEDQNWSEAVFNAKKALSLNTENVGYMQLNASIYRRAGLLQEAEAMYEAIAETGYDKPDLFIDWAELLFDMCEFENGLEILYLGAFANEKAADIHYRIAGYLFTLNREEEAIMYLKKGLRLNAEKRIQFFNLFPKLKKHQVVKELVGKYVKR